MTWSASLPMSRVSSWSSVISVLVMRSQAMDTRVMEVTLAAGVTLDMEALTQYSGQGVCRQCWAE